MDPDTAFADAMEAFHNEEWEEAREVFNALRYWLLSGGYIPKQIVPQTVGNHRIAIQTMDTLITACAKSALEAI